MKKVILCDLDRTLSFYGEWDRGTIGKPIPAMLAKVKAALNNGDEVRIFTARADDPKNIPPIKAWLKKVGLPDLKVTNEKTPDATEIWDDKAKEVVGNKGTFIDSPRVQKPIAGKED
jgi:hypothetical protein